MRPRESEERAALRAAVADLGKRYGRAYFDAKARGDGGTPELWDEAGRLGYLGVALPEAYGGGGGGLGDLAIVVEELAAAGCPLLLTVVSPAICGTILARYGTDEQRTAYLPGIADGTLRMAFAITEPDAGSNSHRITTAARPVSGPDGDGWSLTGRKTYISAVDQCHAVLVVARVHDERSGKLRPALFVVPTDAPGFEYRPLAMDLYSAEGQFLLFLDDVRLPADALVGHPDAGLSQLFAGLNPERITVAAYGAGLARHALDLAVAYARTREVFDRPIGAHQAVAHPLAESAVELEMVRLLVARAADAYDGGDEQEAAEAANMAKYAAAEACVRAVDRAIQTHGGAAFTAEYGLGALAAAARMLRVVPVSREMILNYVAQHTLDLPKSY